MRRLAPLLLLLAAFPAAGQEKPAAAEPTAAERGREAVAGGIEFLLKTQNADGSWGHHAHPNPYQLYAPVPGAHRAFRVATSALAMMALRRAPDTTKGIREARSKGLLYLVEQGRRVKRSHGRGIYAVWGWGYGLQALARYLADPIEGADEKGMRATAARIVHELAAHQTVDGGWGYFDFNMKTYRPSSGTSMSFTTATVLIALSEAREAGVEVPEASLAKALRSLERCRTREGSYLYSFSHLYRPHGLINRPSGSLSRRPACDLALHLFDKGITSDDLRKGLEVLLEKRKFGRMALHRPVPHQSWFAVSGYFYLYGYFYAAEVSRLLPEKAVTPLRDGLIEEVLVTRHPDGSFWDYPMYGYHKPYGTAYAVLTLLELLRARDPREAKD